MVVAECVTDFDCVNIKGKTPCNLPACDKTAGKCVLKLRQAGESCTNPLDEAGECEVAACTATGECLKTARPSGTKCGLGACGKKCDGVGLCVAASASDYDDKNPCTIDYCDQGKIVKHEPISSLDATCNDNNACTDADICVNGACKGTDKACNDSIPCTKDTCDPAKGCVFQPVKELCANNEPCVNIGCDLAEGCTTTSIKVGPCDDGNGCTEADKCVTGKCVGTASSKLCGCKTDVDCAEKNTPCGGKFACKAGTCLVNPETIVVCTASEDICSTAKCDPGSGDCIGVPNNEGKACDDNNSCTTATLCTKGVCSGGPVTCDDKNPCTLDNCDPKKGCVTAPTTGVCDDGVKCTSGDACNALGLCSGAKVSCDDGVPCTYDQCDENSGKCVSQGQDNGCNDNNPCTKDSCGAKGCVFAADDTGKCDDGNACTSDTCSAGACKSVNTCQCAAATDCDDKNPCTVDSCSAGKCAYANAPTTQTCDVANKCVQAGTGICSAGTCTGGKPKDCSALADSCNNAVCNGATGTCEKVSKADSSPCDADGNGCTVGDVCKGGKCLAGAPPPTCKNTACAEQACQSTSATTFKCAVKPLDKGYGCEDGKFCTVEDICDGAGQCAGQPLMCEGSGCYPGVCSETSKQCENIPKKPGEACDDGKFCTSGDVCSETGECISTTQTVCKGGACVIGYCDEGKDACASKPDPNCCSTAAQCDDGKPCTTNNCTLGKCAYSAVASCPSNILYQNDFDTNHLKGMVLDNSISPTQGWQLMYKFQCPAGLPNFCSGPYKDTPGALYFGDFSIMSFNFGASFGNAVTPPISAGAKYPNLDFDLYMATEGGDVYDVLRVWIQQVVPVGTKPPPPIQVWIKKQDFQINGWQHVKVDLAPFTAGMPVDANYAIRFEFNTTDGAANEGFGVVLDQITVTNGVFAP